MADGKGKDAVELFSDLLPPFQIAVEQHLGVRMAEKGIPLFFQFPAQLLGVVKLSVVHQGEAAFPAAAGHGLFAPRRVDHHQPPVNQAHGIGQIDPFFIRPPVFQLFRHLKQHSVPLYRSFGQTGKTRNPAHMHPSCFTVCAESGPGSPMILFYRLRRQKLSGPYPQQAEPHTE